jgi:hypothetical protein
MLQIDGFKQVGTGGNCEALQKSTKYFNILLTDVNGMEVPKEFKQTGMQSIKPE